MSLPLSYFFNLTQYAHTELFEKLDFPWEALPLIANYLKTKPLGRRDGQISPQAYLIHPELISIGEGSVVEPGAYIQGPCILGRNCTVRHGAYIRGNAVVGDGCVIGHATEVKNAIFLNGVHAAHFAYVGDSILGNNVNLGAGTKCANLKLNNGPITVCYPNDQKIQTGLRKFGAILGDNTQLGCNTVTNPGTVMGQEVKCCPCLNVGGFIPSGFLIKTQAPLSVVPYRTSV